MEWVDKHKPTNWSEVLGTDMNLNIVQNFFWAWSQGAPISNALLLAGEEGCGKTTIAEVAAKEHDLEIISMNASDIRNKDAYQTLKVTNMMGSWDKDLKCVFIDECDGLGKRMDGRFGGAGNAGKTAWAQIEQMIEGSRVPIVLCCNYSENIPWRIRNNKNLTTLEMSNKRIPNQQIFNRLMKITYDEGYEPNIKGVKMIVKKCPTIRSAIKTLQLCCFNGNWKAIYPRDIDGSETMKMLSLFRGESEIVPISDTYRIGNYALANGVNLNDITRFNKLAMMRRKVPNFGYHNDVALTFSNKQLQQLSKPTNAFKQTKSATEKKRKQAEEKKRKATVKKIEAAKKAEKKGKPKSKDKIETESWDDLF